VGGRGRSVRSIVHISQTPPIIVGQKVVGLQQSLVGFGLLSTSVVQSSNSTVFDLLWIFRAGYCRTNLQKKIKVELRLTTYNVFMRESSYCFQRV